MKKWIKDFNGFFIIEEIHLANKYMDRWLTSLAMREMQIITIGYHFSFIR